jgi:BlaI family penicillinase repressor
MRNVPRITESEWEVMKVLWEQSPLTAAQIIQILLKKTSWQNETIKTFIKRLVRKKALGFTRKGRQYFYHPLVSEQDCIKLETSTFLKRFKGGPMEPILHSFLELEDLPPESIAGLRKIIEELKASDRKKGQKRGKRSNN